MTKELGRSISCALFTALVIPAVVVAVLLAAPALGEDAAAEPEPQPEYRCPYCKDTGKIECPACRQGRKFWCSECAAENVCPVCQSIGWILCPYCGGEDAKSEHEFHLEHLKRDENLNKAVGTKLRRIETPRFALITDIDHEKSHEFALLLEHFCRVFNTNFGNEPEDRPWAGRCSVYLFQPREAFVKFAATVDARPELAAAGGYSYPSPGGPMIVLFKESRSDDDTLRIIIHELAHVFLGSYPTDKQPQQDSEKTPQKEPAPSCASLPVWLHEGVAQLFEFMHKTETSRRAESLRLVKQAYRNKTLMPMEELAEMKFGANELLPYAVSWSAVDFLMSTDRPAFVKWMAMMKNGVDQHEAFRRSFGFPLGAANRAWRAHIRRLK